jgi:NAD(P)H-hydrate epimerase
VVAIDLPSGMAADVAGPIGPHVAAAMTVTLGAPKLPLVLPPTEGDAGDVVVADIGIPAAVFRTLDGPHLSTIDAVDLRPGLPLRPADAHKGTFGHVLVVAGSRGKTGAAALAARGALRSGAGLATVATPASCLPVVAALAPEYMTLALDDEDGACAASALRTVLDAQADVIAVGPGLGTGPGAAALVRGLLAHDRRPLVIDADAINVLALAPEALRGTPGRPVILTPHPGELARLAGVGTADIQRDRLAAVRGTAARHGVHVVLKGHRTLVAAPDGCVSINTTGNPGMATGGSGDVLTGMIAAWMAQVVDPAYACRLAVYLHGLAGDLAAIAESETALIAGDIVDHLGAAMRVLAGEDDEGHGADAS